MQNTSRWVLSFSYLRCLQNGPQCSSYPCLVLTPCAVLSHNATGSLWVTTECSRSDGTSLHVEVTKGCNFHLRLSHLLSHLSWVKLCHEKPSQEASCGLLPTATWVSLEMDPSASVNLSENGSPGQHLDCHLPELWSQITQLSCSW